MKYCTSTMDSPEFFAGVGTCEVMAHDLKTQSGGLATGDGLTSAVLIQLGTDARANGQRGWWGDQFQPFPIGSAMWTLGGNPQSQQGLGALIDEYARAALSPLIKQDLIDEISVRTVRTITGSDVSIDMKRGNATIAEARFNG